MKVGNGKLVSIIYDLHIGNFDGELIESVTEDGVVEFLFGKGEMLETFEEKILGLKEGDTFKFELKKEEAYGDEDEESIVEFPKDMFLENGEELPEIGDYTPMEDEDGTVFDGVTVDITDDFVIIDFNHPLAGENLFFEGKIIKVEDAE